MNKKMFFGVTLILLGLVGYFFQKDSQTEEVGLNGVTVFGLPDSPLNALYNIAGQEIQLGEGEYEDEHIKVSVFKGPEYGDISGDEKEDTLLVLSVVEGEEERFYLAPALKDDEGYLGLETVMLEKTEEPYSAMIVDQYVTVSYMPIQSPQPSFVEEYYSLSGLVLSKAVIPKEDTIYKGYYIYGHESRVFIPCESEDEYWISPQSPSKAALEAIYKTRTMDSEPYFKIYSVVVGHSTDAPQDGFGAEYPQAIYVDSIVSVPLNGFCSTAVIEAESPENKDHASPQ